MAVATNPTGEEDFPGDQGVVGTDDIHYIFHLINKNDPIVTIIPSRLGLDD